MIVKNHPGQRWAIVGGGMLGLTMAHRMSREGHDVTLIEAAPQLGGLTSVWQLGDITWDKHYHVILLSDSRLRNLLDEIDLGDQLNWVETKTGFYTDGQLYSMSDTKEFLGFPPLKLIEKLRLGGTIFYASKIRNWKRLEKIPVTDWLRRWSGKGTFEKIWLPLLRAKLGDAYKDTAASFIWAHINRMYKARRTGLKKEMFGYVRGGYRTIIHRLAEKLDECNATVLTDHPIQEIRKTETGSLEINFANQPPRQFDRVIMTTPSTVIGRACPDLNADEQDRLMSTSYLGIVNASLLLRKSLSPYYVTNITDSWVPMTAIVEMSNIVDSSETGGRSLVYLPKYIPADNEMFNRSDDDVREDFLCALEKMHPEFSRDDVEAFQIARARNVMAIPTLRYSESLPPQTTSIPGLFIVNSAYITKGNLNVNETIQIAEDAMDGCLKDELAADLNLINA
ncbi:MAG: NAD(P)/FAD-dependent oxidoreductase [Pirellulaceae bacterium]